MKLGFYQQVCEKYTNFMKIRQVRAELFHADGQMEVSAVVTKLTVAFRNFSNACEKWKQVFWNYRSCCWLKVRILNLK